MLERYRALVRKHERLLGLYGAAGPDSGTEEAWMAAVERLRGMQLVDSEHFLDQAFRDGRDVLAEGAQGTLLDIDFGTYPFVTSSSTICAGACAGLGVPPARIGRVIGIFKAYCTRVGSGPFPTELTDDTGERIRQAGNEFGSTTGRPRRCGWLDLPALRYAVMINGISELAMMKADVLGGMDQVRICTHYRVNGTLSDRMPYDVQHVEPFYSDHEGWGPLGMDIPEALERYIRRIEQAVQVPVRLVSTGPDRRQTIERPTAVAVL